MTTRPLSPAQDRVMRLVANGLRTREIAQVLDLSPRTVEVHRAACHKRLGARTSAHAAVLYLHRERAAYTGVLMPLLDALATRCGGADIARRFDMGLMDVHNLLDVLCEQCLVRGAEGGGWVLTDAGRAIRHDVAAVRALETELGL